MITEYGFPPFDASELSLQQQRIHPAQSNFYLPLLNEILKSIHDDGIKAAEAVASSFVDNWDWGQYQISIISRHLTMSLFKGITNGAFLTT